MAESPVKAARWCSCPTPTGRTVLLRQDVCTGCGWLIVDHNPLRLLQMLWRARRVRRLDGRR